ncbi:fimbrial protein [Citrobacter arsenatis]|uniref:fimbrial protein n=1 Tax=Citrobacter arsenatis TaxID=2546350 RepID=UPI00300DF298
MNIANGRKVAALILACGGFFSSTSQAVNIDITGLVVASPCVVNGSNNSLAVNLGDAIQADDLATAGSATDWKTVTLSLTGCPASTSSFSVAFAGTGDDDDADFYKNTGTATNLKLELTDTSSETAYKNGATLDNVAIPSSHAYDLVMRARAVSKGNVMPGTILGQVQATFTYQ